MKHENLKPTWDDVTRGIEENVQKINELVDQYNREMERLERIGRLDSVWSIIGILLFLAFLFIL